MTQRYRIIVLARAFSELDDIIDYIAKRSPQNAAAVIDRLWEAMQSLSEFPHRFKVHAHHRDRAKIVHSMPVGPHLMYFRINEQQYVVRILSVRHGSRKQPRRFP